MNERKRENQKTVTIAICITIALLIIGFISPMLLGTILIIGFYLLK